jgi:hypothetical protein
MKLVPALDEFAKSNSLSNEQLNLLVGELALGGPFIRKAGLGMIDDSETYVLLGSLSRNSKHCPPCGQEMGGKEFE